MASKGTYTARTGKAGGGGDSTTSGVGLVTVRSVPGTVDKNGKVTRSANQVTLGMKNGQNWIVSDRVLRDMARTLGSGKDFTLTGRSGPRNPRKARADLRESSLTVSSKNQALVTQIQRMAAQVSKSQSSRQKALAGQPPRVHFFQRVTPGRTQRQMRIRTEGS